MRKLSNCSCFELAEGTKSGFTRKREDLNQHLAVFIQSKIIGFKHRLVRSQFILKPLLRAQLGLIRALRPNLRSLNLGSQRGFVYGEGVYIRPSPLSIEIFSLFTSASRLKLIII